MKQHSFGFVTALPAILISLGAVIVGVFATSQISLPGSPLYGIKSSTEEVRIALARTDETKAKTHLSIAATKLSELENLSARAASPLVLARVQEKFEENQHKAEVYIKRDTKESNIIKLNEVLEKNKSRDTTRNDKRRGN